MASISNKNSFAFAQLLRKAPAVLLASALSVVGISIVGVAQASAATQITETVTAGSTSTLGSADFGAQLVTTGGDGSVTFTMQHSGSASSSGTLVTTATANNLFNYNGQLVTTGNTGPVSYAQVSGSADLTVSSLGLVSPAHVLSTGTYVAEGTVSDTNSHHGTFHYTLVVGDGHINVSPTGGVTTTGSLHAGTYPQTGYITDNSQDVGTYNYTLTVTAGTITSTVASGTVSTTGSQEFADQLATTGNTGLVTYAKSTGPASITVSTHGLIETTGTLSAGTYNVTGSTSDDLGDVGTFSYTLTVTPTSITQTVLSGATTVNGSGAFSAQLVPTNNAGAVSYLQTDNSPYLFVSSSGVVSTTGHLLSGSYGISGTTSDPQGDSGVFSYTLVVGTITQAHTTGTVVYSASSSFTDQLVSGNFVGPVTFVQSTGSELLTVSSSGAIATAGQLFAGTYVATGSTRDNHGDTGTFTYTLTVTAGTITSTTTSGTIATTASAAFTDQLATTGNTGNVTFVQIYGDDHISVNTNGVISTNGNLAAGTYVAFGTDSDTHAHTGLFTYTLTVTAGTITSTVTSGRVVTTGSGSFTDQLATTGSIGGVIFTQVVGPSVLMVSNSGSVSTTGNLAAGIYTVTGTTSDQYGNTGTFSYTLTVTAGTIVSTNNGGTIPVDVSGTFTDQLATTGNLSAVTYVQSSGGSSVTVSSSGAIATTGSLPANVYTVTGTTIDTYGNTGTFSYTLTVTPSQITSTVTSGTVTTKGSAGFTDQLATTGNLSNVTFTQAVGPSVLIVSNSGSISTTENLDAGSYTVTGFTSDSFNNTGEFFYTLTVTPLLIGQTVTSGVSTMAGSGTFTDQLVPSNYSSYVTYSQLVGANYLIVSSTGVVSVADSATLLPGQYTVSGTTSDGSGDSGVFSYTLVVGTIQVGPMGGEVGTEFSAFFTDALTPFNYVAPVTFTQESGSQYITVSPSGAVATTGSLAAGMYLAYGTVSDNHGDTGTFSYYLQVDAGTISTTVTSGTVSTQGSLIFTDQLESTGNIGAVTYVQGSGSASITVSASGALAATGTLAAGTYTVTGTTSDQYGNTGTFSYTLTVVAGTITSSDTSGSVVTTSSGSFSHQLMVTGNIGAVSYVKSGGSSRLVVSSGGVVSTTGTLAAGTYTVSGTTSDQYGNTGTFSYLLRVSAGMITVSVARGSVMSAMSAQYHVVLRALHGAGRVTFAGLSRPSALKVTAAGKVFTVGTLRKGTYRVQVSMHDAYGDAGQFTFTLRVS